MSEENLNQEENTNTDANELVDTGAPVDNLQPLVVDELLELKKRADTMGVSYHPNIGVDKLREKINLKLRTNPNENYDEGIEPGIPNPNQFEAKSEPDYSADEIAAGYVQGNVKLSPSQERNQAIKDANKLVRIRLTCMNPNKREWNGEVFTVSNSVVGTFKKFVPFNIPEGWHVPSIIFQAIKERMCQVFVNGTAANGQPIKKAMAIPEFGVEVLPPLTADELKDLAQRQAMANGTSR